MKRPPWPLRIIYFVVALCLAFWLIATLVWFEFGRNAEEQMVDLALDVTTLVGIVLVPIFVVGLIAVPFYRWIANKLVGFIEDRDHQV
jgi:ABC-type Co2+ transport system permease subunit